MSALLAEQGVKQMHAKFNLLGKRFEGCKNIQGMDPAIPPEERDGRAPSKGAHFYENSHRVEGGVATTIR